MRLARRIRDAAFVLSGCREVTWGEQRRRPQEFEPFADASFVGGELPLVAAAPLEFQSVIGLTTVWPYGPVVATPA